MNLQVSDLDLERGVIAFHAAAGLHERQILLPHDVRHALACHLATSWGKNRKSRGQYGDRLFDVGGHTVEGILARHSDRTLGRHVTLEILRSSRIFALIQAGWPLWEIAWFTGVHDLNRFWRYLPQAGRDDESVPFGDPPSHAAEPTWFPPNTVDYLKSFNKRRRNRRLRRI